jgi:hypothetical protein
LWSFFDQLHPMSCIYVPGGSDAHWHSSTVKRKKGSR